MNLRWRFRVVVFLVVFMAAIVSGRVVYLQVIDTAFLRQQGDARSLRHVPIAASRGLITDRAGRPLAVSTPMVTVWGDARVLMTQQAKWPLIAQALDVPLPLLAATLRSRRDRAFSYLRRGLSPEQGQRLVQVLQREQIHGVHIVEQPRRFYPAGAVAAHVVGVTDRDNRGSEGMELTFDATLRGVDGRRRLVKDRRGNVIEDLGVSRAASPGQALALSLDLPLQYLANRELRHALDEHGAVAGNVVVLDARSGEVLALASQPTFNPNNRARLRPSLMRNRALVDVFEPASTLKPFAVAAALESGRWLPGDTVKVETGSLQVGRYLIRDASRTSGEVLDMTQILVRSSNVAISTVAFDIGAARIHGLLRRAGLGQATGTGFPGERSGALPARKVWQPAETATLAYGYGVSLTAVQLARAYAALANGGQLLPVSLLRVDAPPAMTQALSPGIADRVRDMLVQVVEDRRGIHRARVPGYRVGGKSGTARLSRAGSRGYAGHAYRAIFAGFAPARAPRFVVVVVIEDPTRNGYYGGRVAAPVFSRVMAHALRLYQVAPDNLH